MDSDYALFLRMVREGSVPIEVDDDEEEEFTSWFESVEYEEEEEETEYEEEEEEEEEDDDENEPAVAEPPRVFPDNAASSVRDGGVEEEEAMKRRRTEGGGEAAASSSNGVEGRVGSQGQDLIRGEIEGSCCPICMDAWTGEGDHHICCLPCGHIYGMSCIEKWLQQKRGSAKCPQCNRKCGLKDVRKIFAPKIVVIDEESQKRIRFLETKCNSLEKKDKDWCKKEADWQNKEADLNLKIRKLQEGTRYLELLLGDKERRLSGFGAASRGSHEQALYGHAIGSNFGGHGSPCSFILQKELPVDGARLFDIDAHNQIIIIARRLSRIGGTHVLTKMSLIPPYESENLSFPPITRAVKDLHISPFDSSLALFTSLEKKLSIISMESNNVILTSDLPVPAWSCCWDINNSHYMYAGLQNGCLLVFDTRHTMKPVESLEGLTSNPIHTVCSLSHDQPRTVLTASSIGLCQWNVGQRPCLVPGTENQGVCISLAYCPHSDDIVASYRPKIETSNEMTATQPSLTPPSVIGQGVQGSRVLLKRVGSSCYQKFGSTCAKVNDIRLPRSVIIDIGNEHRLFTSGDEVASELTLLELPSLTVHQHLTLPKQPIYDVKYTHAGSQGLLGCLSDDALQIFSTKFS